MTSFAERIQWVLWGNPNWLKHVLQPAEGHDEIYFVSLTKLSVQILFSIDWQDCMALNPPQRLSVAGPFSTVGGWTGSTTMRFSRSWNGYWWVHIMILIRPQSEALARHAQVAKSKRRPFNMGQLRKPALSIVELLFSREWCRKYSCESGSFEDELLGPIFNQLIGGRMKSGVRAQLNFWARSNSHARHWPALLAAAEPKIQHLVVLADVC